MVEGQRSAGNRGNDFADEWVGSWLAFAAVMLMIVGGLHFAFGIVAVLSHNWPGWTLQNHAFLSVRTWGWIQIVIGVALFVAGMGVVLGRPAARVVGIVFAALSLIDGFFLIPLYPWWAIIIIGIDVAVIWALTAHWRGLGTR